MILRFKLLICWLVGHRRAKLFAKPEHLAAMAMGQMSQEHYGNLIFLACPRCKSRHVEGPDRLVDFG